MSEEEGEEITFKRYAKVPFTGYFYVEFCTPEEDGNPPREEILDMVETEITNYGLNEAIGDLIISVDAQIEFGTPNEEEGEEDE